MPALTAGTSQRHHKSVGLEWLQKCVQAQQLSPYLLYFLLRAASLHPHDLIGALALHQLIHGDAQAVPKGLVTSTSARSAQLQSLSAMGCSCLLDNVLPS